VEEVARAVQEAKGEPAQPADGAVRARVIVSGRVQGVFFRASTPEAAEKLELRGWVRNARDGSVEMAVEGPRERVEAMLAWCWKGSTFSRVDDVAIEWEKPRPAEVGFEVRR